MLCFTAKVVGINVANTVAVKFTKLVNLSKLVAHFNNAVKISKVSEKWRCYRQRCARDKRFLSRQFKSRYFYFGSCMNSFSKYWYLKITT